MIIFELLHATLETMVLLYLLLAFVLKVIVDAIVQLAIVFIKKAWYILSSTLQELAYELLFFIEKVKQTNKM